jgi:hypothetical protein
VHGFADFAGRNKASGVLVSSETDRGKDCAALDPLVWLFQRLSPPEPWASLARAMETWLAPFAAMFAQPTWLNAVALAAEALRCLNRRTVCSALRAAGHAREGADGAPDKGFSRLHRFLPGGVWRGLEGSKILPGLPVKAFVPDRQPLVVGVDDSIERRRGGKIRDKGICRDPVRSSRGFVVKVEGLRWLSFHLLARPGFARRTGGVPP